MKSVPLIVTMLLVVCCGAKTQLFGQAQSISPDIQAKIAEYEQSGRLPSTLEGKLDGLISSWGDHDLSPGVDISLPYFLSLGPSTVPILWTKLQASLARPPTFAGSSEPASLKLAVADRESRDSQQGLIGLLQIALQEMTLDSNVRSQALVSIHQALGSPYSIVRGDAVEAVAKLEGRGAIQRLLPLLNDQDDLVRTRTLATLRKIGDRSTAVQIVSILNQRKQGLTSQQIQQDSVFYHADKAISVLNEKAPAKDKKP